MKIWNISLNQGRQLRDFMLQMKQIWIQKMSQYPQQLRCLFYLVFSSEGGYVAMQCFSVWIAMQFVHACCLSLYFQFQCPGQRSLRGGSASKTKGSAAMSPGRMHSKRVNSTRPGEFALGVRTQRLPLAKGWRYQQQENIILHHHGHLYPGINSDFMD